MTSLERANWAQRSAAIIVDRPALRLGVPAVVVALAELVTVAFNDGRSWHNPGVLQVILILTGAGALLLRLRHPLATTVVTLLCGTALPFVAPHYVIFNASSVVALFTLAILGDRRIAWATAVVGVVGLTISSALWLPGNLLNIRNLLPANYVTIAVAVGDSVRNRRALLLQAQERVVQAERTREQEAQRLVQGERIRIARDLHDVVAHHITLVNAQAGVAHHLIHIDPDKAFQALADIKETSRTALDELRATVGLLRQENDPPQSLQPAPRFEFLEDLLAHFRTTGFHIRLARQGAVAPLTGTADLAAYRIVQEALTNASKHSTRPCADIWLTYTDSTLNLGVTNPARADNRGPGSGQGLVGMRERAEAAGGVFRAALHPDGVFVVQATLPLRSVDELA